MSTTIKLAGLKRNLDSGNGRLYVHELGNPSKTFVLLDEGEAMASWGLKRFNLYTCAKPFSEPASQLQNVNWELTTEHGKDINCFFNGLSSDNQVKVLSIKEELENKFRTEQAIGIHYAEYGSMIPADQFSEEEKEKTDIYAFLPNDEEMGRCTNCALYVAEQYPGRSEVYGFYCEDNPECTHKEVTSAFGHDFCVIDNRYIVDFWVSLYTGSEQQSVFDLEDKNDHAKIKQIYGNPERWSVMVDGSFVKYNDHKFPENLRVKRVEVKESELSI
ncbi:hypothetical protein NI385_27910 (plasmid) [Vibrio parahaemolyticus]|uniref:hypothetical protein n=1 Tax=Vibrio TaxID=662 RepID=UPI0005F1D0B4|nr:MULTISPECIES: hypothetical protein [Vibrio]EGR2217241.1 hypothetical protein [Vibrio parahaemolyticus]MBE4204901.1 hypothetical protein [Vibrio parahaemolyticus]TBT51062.1 hypothetical protein D5E78_04560 [Vibrio parahaemolyticus]WMN81249.1 hypothetical protein NI385_27910 [Vibrio parahaemolyticus]